MDNDPDVEKNLRDFFCGCDPNGTGSVRALNLVVEFSTMLDGVDRREINELSRDAKVGQTRRVLDLIAHSIVRKLRTDYFL
jgi:hypothetical protein